MTSEKIDLKKLVVCVLFTFTICHMPPADAFLGWCNTAPRKFIAIAGAAGLALTAYYYKTRPTNALPNLVQRQTDLYYDSKSPDAAIKQEPVEWAIKCVYMNNIFGKLLRYFGVELAGKYVTQREARLKNSHDKATVAGFLNHYYTLYNGHINMDEYVTPEGGFSSFNDWFTRKLKNPDQDRPMEHNNQAVASPADSKLIIIPNLATDTLVTIKEELFDLETFLHDKELAQLYVGGVMMIFRLAPYNYHRYHYPCDCTVSPEIAIDGKYHSVNTRAFMCGEKPLTVNKRSYEVLTPIGTHARNKKVVMMQVGATAVASIVNNFMGYDPEGKPLKLRDPQKIYQKGEETGYFQFGGSTIVLLFPKDTIIPNAQIVKNSLNGYETDVKVRETIAYWK